MTTAQQQALRIVRAEHQTLAAVVDALRHVADDIAQGRLTPDYKLLWSIIYYIEAFPETLHHPKEDQVLFPRVRRRTHDIDAALDELTSQHANSRPHLDRLKTLLGRMEADIPGAAAEFDAKVRTYADFHWKHMSLEETAVLPKAVEVLTEADWEGIAAAFAENRDPLHGNSDNEWFRQFYRRIVNLVPEPWGLGPRR
ncbi:MAG: hemerythrin domain-containing protein [Burkholderiales bacterium]|nr:hemerythrin domain-containing protein [Burkholderiales bacterium]